MLTASFRSPFQEPRPPQPINSRIARGGVFSLLPNFKLYVVELTLASLRVWIFGEPRRTGGIRPLQERPQLVYVLDLLKFEHTINKTLRKCGSYDRCHEVERFCDYLLSRQRDLNVSGNIVLNQTRAILEDDLNLRVRPARKARLQSHFLPQSHDCRILHARLVMDGPERDLLVDQHQRQQVLYIQIRPAAVVRVIVMAADSPEDNLLHLARIDGLPLQ